MAAPILQHESRPLKKRCFGRSRSLLFNKYFLQMFALLTLQSPFTHICICNHLSGVSFQKVSRVIVTQYSEVKMDLVFCFLSCLVKFPVHEANSWWRRESSNPGNWVCVFFSFFALPTVLAFFHDQTHTLTQTRRCEDTRKGRKGTESSSLHSSLDYRWMFDSECSFSLKYDLIRPPY